MATDFKSLGLNHQVSLITGGLAVILTFFPAYVTASIKAKGTMAKSLGSLGTSASHNAWVEWATLGTLLIIAAFALLAVKIFAGQVLPEGAPWSLIIAGAAGLGTLLLVIYAFTFGPGVPSFASDSISYSAGPGWSGWALLVVAIVFTVFAALGFKESGEKMPEFGGNKKA